VARSDVDRDVECHAVVFEATTAGHNLWNIVLRNPVQYTTVVDHTYSWDCSPCWFR